MQKITQSYTFEDGVKACLPTVLGYVGIGLVSWNCGQRSGLKRTRGNADVIINIWG